MITNEMKAKIAALYMGCFLKYPPFDNKDFGVVQLGAASYYDFVNGSMDAKLLLTPLSEITDEDAIAVAKMHYMNRDELIDADKERYIKNTKKYIINPVETVQYYIADFLRSKSYALPYMGIDLFASGIAIPNNKNQ